MKKKIAVLESLKAAHYKEVFRSKYKLDELVKDKESTLQTLNKLSADEGNYKSRLQFEKDGTKTNPIQIKGFNSSDPEAIGRHLISLSTTWKPDANQSDAVKIGTLYGFDLVIRRQREAYEAQGTFDYCYKNIFYAESKESGLKYFWNQGHLNADNPKLATRYFLNAIDRSESLKEKYQKSLQDFDSNIPMLQQLINKSFEKDEELSHLKNEVSRVEREITIKIQANQIKQTTEANEQVTDKKETPVVKIDTKEQKNGKSLLPKKEAGKKKAKSLRI